MRRAISTLLSLMILLNAACITAFASESDIVPVQIPCQYITDFKINEGTINGYYIDGGVYVPLSVVEMLTSYNATEENSVITFMKNERSSSFFYRLDLNSETIIRYAWLMAETEWPVSVRKLPDGDYVINLEEVLVAMNVQMAFSNDEEYMLCTYLPYTVYDAWIEFQKSNPLLFSWDEIKEDQGDADPTQLGILSAINSLYIDYNDHFVADAVLAWWADGVLTATEEELMDAMTEILLCLSEDRNDFLSDDSLYKTYKQDNKVVGLSVKLLKLLNIDEEISDITSALGKGSSLVDKGITSLDIANTLLQYQSIQETQKDVLANLFVTFPLYADAQDSASRQVYNAANHLCQRMESEGIGATTTICDAVTDLFVGKLEATIAEVTPILVAVKATPTIMKITPGISELVDASKHTNIGCNTWALLMLSIYNYSYWAESFYNYNFPTEDEMNQLKLTMLFRIMASLTARQQFIATNALQKTTVDAMNVKNEELTKLYFLIESSESITAPEDNSPKVDWENYLDAITELDGSAKNFWLDFLSSGTYKDYTTEWTELYDVEAYGHNPYPTDYAILDINGDGWEELLLTRQQDNDLGFAWHSVLSLDKANGTVCVVPNESHIEGSSENYYDIAQNCRGLSYSPTYHAIVYTELNNGSMFNDYGYWILEDGHMIIDFSVGYDNYSGDGTYYISQDGITQNITEDEFSNYIDEWELIEFFPIAEVKATESSSDSEIEYVDTDTNLDIYNSNGLPVEVESVYGERTNYIYEEATSIYR